MLINIEKYKFVIERRKGSKGTNVFPLVSFFVEGGRCAENGEANDEGKKIYKICIGRVRRATVHDASGFPRQRRRI